MNGILQAETALQLLGSAALVQLFVKKFLFAAVSGGHFDTVIISFYFLSPERVGKDDDLQRRFVYVLEFRLHVYNGFWLVGGRIGRRL